MKIGDCFISKIPHMVVASVQSVIIIGIIQYKKDNLIVFASLSDWYYDTYNIFGKEKFSIQQHYILLWDHQCQFHMLHIPLVFILIHLRGGIVHGHILLRILDHIM